MNINKIIGNLILIIHTILFLICLFILLFSYNVKYNLIIYYYIIIASIGWLVFNTCALTPLENYFLSDKEKSSMLSVILSKVFNYEINDINIFIVYMNFTIFIMLSLKILYIKKVYK